MMVEKRTTIHPSLLKRENICCMTVLRRTVENPPPPFLLWEKFIWKPQRRIVAWEVVLSSFDDISVPGNKSQRREHCVFVTALNTSVLLRLGQRKTIKTTTIIFNPSSGGTIYVAAKEKVTEGVENILQTSNLDVKKAAAIFLSRDHCAVFLIASGH